MRESLTILAVAVILVLTALLVGPYFINWNDQRDVIAARLSEAVGAKVQIGGAIDVKLLPRPIFRVGQVTLQGRTPQDPRVTVGTLDAELSINGLLQGAIDFVDATVKAPQIELTVRADGSIVGPALDVGNPQSFQFKHVTITDGAIVVRDEKGAPQWSVAGLNASGEADSLTGPLKASGTVADGDRRIAFRLNTGAYAARKLRVKLTLDGGETFARVDADGTLTFETPKAGTHPFPNYDGVITLAGSLHVADGAAPVPWRLVAAGVKTEGQTLNASALELRAGSDGRALVANGAGTMRFGPAASAAIQLRARQLDLDRAAVPPDVAPDTPRPSADQWIAAIDHWIAASSAPPMALSLDMGIDAVTRGDLTLTDAAIKMNANQGRPLSGHIAIAGPDATRVALDGTFETGAAAAFTGTTAAATRDLGSVAQWLAPLWPAGADWIRQTPGIQAVDLTAGLTLSKIGLAARDMRLTIDGSTVSGIVSVTKGVGEERPRLFADLTADKLDTAHLPDLTRASAAASAFDLSIGLKADSARLTGADVAPIDTGHLALHLTKVADAVTLDQFSVTGLGGAAVVATASLDASRTLRTAGHIDAKDVGPLAAILRQIAPDAATDLVALHAASLSPLSLAFKGEATLDQDGGVTPTVAEAQGTLGAVRTSMTVTPEAAARFTAPQLATVLTLDAADVGAVLRQWGFAPPAGQLGTGHLEATAHGTLKDGFKTDAALTLSDIKANFAGRLTPTTGSGHVKIGGASAQALVRTLGLSGPLSLTPSPWSGETDLAWHDGSVALDKLTARLNGSTATGALQYAPLASPPTDGVLVRQLSGSLAIDATSLASLASLALPPQSAPPRSDMPWSPQGFAAMAPLPRSEIGLKIGTLEVLPSVQARDVGLTLRIGPGSVTLADLSGRLLGGSGLATVTLRRDGPQASVGGRVEFNDLALNLPSLAGQFSTKLNLAATGSSPDTLMASLAGQGSVAMTGARMPRLDPGALDRVAKAFDVDGATVEDEAVRDALAAALDKGALSLGTLSAQATVAAGTLRTAALPAQGTGFSATSEAAFDLRKLDLTLRTTVTTTQQPKDWKGDLPQVTVTWSGPFQTPNRIIDAAAFVNGLSARAIAREQERIEMMQYDLHERSFFARRLKQIEAEQQAAREAVRLQNLLQNPPKPVPAPQPKTPVTGGTDDITKLLNGLNATGKAATPALQLQPPPPVPPIGTGPSATTLDPSAAGRY